MWKDTLCSDIVTEGSSHNLPGMETNEDPPLEADATATTLHATNRSALRWACRVIDHLTHASDKEKARKELGF